MSVRELKKGDFLYRKGDNSQWFFFMLKGKIEIVVESGGEFKFSKNADEFEFFGMKQFTSELRNDFARVVTEVAWVLFIHKDQYELIVKKTQLSASEQKIDFLIRYVPKLRSVNRSMIEELEVFFMK
jgi:signal-transduction protein with cAMP-binding, CBS, and nucleotidyltransferase domain